LRRVSAAGRRFSPKDLTNNSRPLSMNTNAGCGYIRPFNSVVSLLPSPKNISRGFSGLHQTITSGVLDSMLAGNTSGARLAPSPLASLSRKPVVTDVGILDRRIHLSSVRGSARNPCGSGKAFAARQTTAAAATRVESTTRTRHEINPRLLRIFPPSIPAIPECIPPSFSSVSRRSQDQQLRVHATFAREFR